MRKWVVWYTSTTEHRAIVEANDEDELWKILELCDDVDFEAGDTEWHFDSHEEVIDD